MNEEIFKIVEMGLKLGRVERGVSHPDGKPETDTDHSVSLAWLACSLAEAYPELDEGLIAQFAVVHDAVEVYAGDTYAVTAGEEGRKEQKRLEEAALTRIGSELEGLSWLPAMISLYEAQDTPEARFVHLVDKLIPKIVLRLEGNVAERLKMHGTDEESIRSYREYEDGLFAGDEFPELGKLRLETYACLSAEDILGA